MGWGRRPARRTASLPRRRPPQGVLALNVPVPGFRRHLLLTKTLEWNLYWWVHRGFGGRVLQSEL